MNRSISLVLVITAVLIVTYTIAFPFQNNNPQAQTSNFPCYNSPVCIWNDFNSPKCARGFNSEPVQTGCSQQDTFPKCMQYRLCGVLNHTNMPPVANAGPNQPFVIDNDDDGEETVTLDGTGSRDYDGYIASYKWSGGTGSFTFPNNAMTRTTLPVGSHIITLKVTDDKESFSENSINITISPPPPLTPPFTPPSFPLSTTIPTTIPFPIPPSPPPPIAFPAPITLPDTLIPTFPMPPSPSSINCSSRTTSEACFVGQYPIYQCRWDAQCSARHESFTNRVICDTPTKRLSKDECETLPSVCSWNRWMACSSGESEEIDNFCGQELNMTSCSAIRPCQWRSPYYIFPEQCVTNNPLFSEVCSTQSTRNACESYQPCGISFTTEQCGSIYPYFMRECEAVNGIAECNAPLCKFEGNCVNR